MCFALSIIIICVSVLEPKDKISQGLAQTSCMDSPSHRIVIISTWTAPKVLI